MISSLMNALKQYDYETSLVILSVPHQLKGQKWKRLHILSTFSGLDNAPWKESVIETQQKLFL